MNKSFELAAMAEKVDSEGFLQLVDHVIHLLSSEKSKTKDMKIIGSVVKMPPKGEATIIGDIHGDLDSLLRIIDESNFVENAKQGKDVYAIFLGDYGDRGVHSPEVYFAVLSLKKMFPEKAILLRGNHEGPEDLLAHPHDLPLHLGRKFGDKVHVVYEGLTRLFEHLYLAVIVGNRYVMLHGGIPSKAESLEDVAYACEMHPAESHLEEILWSDPVEGISGTLFSPRGAGRLFGKDVTERFLGILDAQMIIRGHEPADDGYKINHDGKVLTLFSRKGPPYYNHQGAYLQLNLSENIEDAYQIRRFLRWI